MRDIGLFASADDLPARATNSAFRQFGGTKVFAATPIKLSAEIEHVCRGIVQVSAKSWGLAPSLLRYLVQAELDAEVPKRAFNALVGSCLRRGDLDAVICEGRQGTPFRIVIHHHRNNEFRARARETANQLYKCRALQISELRDRYFKYKPKGSWTQVMYLAARLVRLGIAEYQDQYSIKMPDVVANAVMHSNESFNSLDAGRMVSN